MAGESGAAATAGAGATPGQSGSEGQQSGQGAGQGQGTQQAQQQQNGATPDAAANMQTDAGREALRRERDRAEAAEKALKELQEKDLPAAERAQRRAAELEASDSAKTVEIQNLKTQNAAIRAAIRLGFADPDDALGFLALNRDKIDFDSASNAPTNLEPLLKDLLKAKPHLARGATPASNGSGDGGARGGSPVDMNARIREAARR